MDAVDHYSRLAAGKAARKVRSHPNCVSLPLINTTTPLGSLLGLFTWVACSICSQQLSSRHVLTVSHSVSRSVCVCHLCVSLFSLCSVLTLSLCSLTMPLYNHTITHTPHHLYLLL